MTKTICLLKRFLYYMILSTF